MPIGEAGDGKSFPRASWLLANENVTDAVSASVSALVLNKSKRVLLPFSYASTLTTASSAVAPRSRAREI